MENGYKSNFDKVFSGRDGAAKTGGASGHPGAETDGRPGYWLLVHEVGVGMQVEWGN